MSTQSNTVYLAYSQDAVKRLPLAIAHALRQYGYNVFMDTGYIDAYENPSQPILDEIGRRQHFVILLTRASYIHGFGAHGEKRVFAELMHAKNMNRDITVVQGYGYNGNNLRQRYIKRDFPETYQRVILRGNGIGALAARLNRLFKGAAAARRQSSLVPLFTDSQLLAEAEVDAGLVERNSAEFFNRHSTEMEYFERAIQFDPEYADAYYQRAIERSSHIPHRSQPEKLKPVLDDYNRAIELQPNEPRYYRGRSSVYDGLGLIDAALSDDASAIRCAPDDGRNYIRRGDRLLFYANRVDEAIQDFTTVINRQLSQMAEAYRGRSSAYKHKGDIQHALDDLNQLIPLDTQGYYYGYLMRGFLYYDHGDIERAEADWREGASVRYSERFFLIKAQMHRNRSEFQLALATIDEYLKQQPMSPNALHWREIILADKQAHSNSPK